MIQGLLGFFLCREDSFFSLSLCILIHLHRAMAQFWRCDAIRPRELIYQTIWSFLATED